MNTRWPLMFLTALSFACNVGGNTPPKFKTFNGEEVKYLFGFAYLPSSVFSPTVLQPNTRWTIDIEVSDANGDDIEILFPSAPGTIYFDQESHSGYWDIPNSVPNPYPGLQVLAVDSQGASDVLFLNIEVFQEWDTGLWDTGLWDTGFRNDWTGEGPHLVGDLNIETGLSGSIQFLDPFGRCKITWSEVEGVPIAPCEQCAYAWKLYLENGEPETRQSSCLETLSALESRAWNIGWAEEVEWNSLYFASPVMYRHSVAGWMPSGSGSVEQNRFSFTLDLNER